MQTFDVIIVGGGLAGATLANCLRARCDAFSVAVIEAHQSKGDYHPSFDDRSIALAAQSVGYLKQFGLFDDAWPYAEAISHVTVSDRGHFGKTYIDKAEFGVDALGYVVEVKPFGQALQQKMQQHDVSVFCPARCTRVERNQQNVMLTLDSGEQVAGRLLVVADGAQSPTRQMLGIDFSKQAYSQHGIIANIGVEGGHANQAFERFTSTGPMALLPLSRDRYSLVWCVPPEQADELLALDENEFLARLQKAFGFAAGRFTQAGQRAAYPLVYGRAEQLSDHRCVIVGNAAHAIHPIAGQGFNLGLRDIQALVELISDNPQSLGDYAFTRRYAQLREGDIARVMTLTDSLVRLFSNSSRTLALGRSTGLMAMDLVPAFKAPLAKQLMGQVKP